MKFPALLATALFAGTALTAHASLIAGGTENPLSTSISYNANSVHGYDFVSTTNQPLTALGFWDSGANGLAAAVQVGLWDTGTQVLLATATIDNADALDLSVTVVGGNWRYETLGAAVNLTSGTTYTIGWLQPLALQNTPDSLVIDYPTLTTAATVTVADQSRLLASGSLQFPTTTTPGGARFRGAVNAQFAPAPASVPEPGTALAGLALVGLVGARRRRSV